MYCGDQYILTLGTIKRNPNKEISSEDLLSFVNRFYEIILLRYDSKKDAYVAHDAEWFKKRFHGFIHAYKRLLEYWNSHAKTNMVAKDYRVAS